MRAGFHCPSRLNRRRPKLRAGHRRWHRNRLTLSRESVGVECCWRERVFRCLCEDCWGRLGRDSCRSCMAESWGAKGRTWVSAWSRLKTRNTKGAALSLPSLCDTHALYVLSLILFRSSLGLRGCRVCSTYWVSSSSTAKGGRASAVEDAMTGVFRLQAG